MHEMRMYIKIAHEQGKAVLVSSHLLSEVELMCDRVIIIQHGNMWLRKIFGIAKAKRWRRSVYV